MNSVVREFIRFELCTYRVNKASLENPEYSILISQRHLVWLSTIVQGIESAVSSLPEDIQEYVELRYFRKNYCNNAGLALKLNISERTVVYWDRLVLTTVAKHIGILNSTNKIA